MPTTRRVLRDPETGATEPYAGIKKATQAAQQGATTAAGTGSKYGSSADTVASTLVPTLQKEATNPAGYMPEDLNNMLVASQQGAGGAAAGVAGEAGNIAARTRNTGALSGVLDEAARQRARASSTGALDIATKNAALKQQQQQAGLKGLEGLYGTDVGAQLKAQSLVPEDIDAWAKANQTGWLQNVDQTLAAVGGASKGPMAYV